MPSPTPSNSTYASVPLSFCLSISLLSILGWSFCPTRLRQGALSLRRCTGVRVRDKTSHIRYNCTFGANCRVTREIVVRPAATKRGIDDRTPEKEMICGKDRQIQSIISTEISSCGTLPWN